MIRGCNFFGFFSRGRKGKGKGGLGGVFLLAWMN